MEPAILVASFGTTHLDTLQENITRTETDIAAAFPGCALYRAFTSRVVRHRLKTECGILVDGVKEAMTRIAADGYTRVVVQPTLLIPGKEYNLLCASVKQAAGELRFSVGRPLLCDSNDLDKITTILRESYPTEKDTILLAMGHGTEHNANHLYEQLAEKFRTQEYSPMRLCTVEGTPTFADALQELKVLPQRKVLLVPLLFVAGEHAKNDMVGMGVESLRSLLLEDGFQVSSILHGLGQLLPIRELYVQRALAAAAYLADYGKCGHSTH